MESDDQNRLTLRLLVREREDVQDARKRMDNRVGRKANGDHQEVGVRAFTPEDLAMFENIADVNRKREKELEKLLGKTLKRFEVYNRWLSTVKGVGPVAAAKILSEFDIHKADTVSKMWSYAGLNPGKVFGKKRIKDSDGNHVDVESDTQIRGDRMAPGFVSPFNKRLRTALCGVLADGFIKAKAYYALQFYYPYKERLEHSEKLTTPNGKKEPIAWKDTTKAHRDRAAKRYMIKMFLKDLYAVWREVEGLPVREPYQEQYLGHVHKEKEVKI